MTLKKYSPLVHKINEQLGIYFNSLVREQPDDLKPLYTEIGRFVTSNHPDKPPKRLRPLFFIAAAKQFGDFAISDALLRASIHVENFHNFTLIHDDIMDECDVRRNLPAMHVRLKHLDGVSYDGKIFSDTATRLGVSRAINAGDILSYRSITDLLSSCENGSYLAMELLQGGMQVMHGQELDLMTEGTRPTLNQYFTMVEKKTAQLFVSSIVMGAAYSSTDFDLKSLEEFGKNFGIAFQLTDDLLDTADGHGRIKGSDLRQGKENGLVIMLRESMGSKDSEIFNTYCGTGNIDPCIELLDKHGVYKRAYAMIDSHIDSAKRVANHWDVSFFADSCDYVLSKAKEVTR